MISNVYSPSVGSHLATACQEIVIHVVEHPRCAFHAAILFANLTKMQSIFLHSAKVMSLRKLLTSCFV
jgi:hypothetical protein